VYQLLQANWTSPGAVDFVLWACFCRQRMKRTWCIFSHSIAKCIYQAGHSSASWCTSEYHGPSDVNKVGDASTHGVWKSKARHSNINRTRRTVVDHAVSQTWLEAQW